MSTPGDIYTMNLYHASMPMGDRMMVEEIDYFIPDEKQKKPAAKKAKSKKRSVHRKKSIKKKRGGSRK